MLRHYLCLRLKMRRGDFGSFRQMLNVGRHKLYLPDDTMYTEEVINYFLKWALQISICCNKLPSRTACWTFEN